LDSRHERFMRSITLGPVRVLEGKNLEVIRVPVQDRLGGLRRDRIRGEVLDLVSVLVRALVRASGLFS